MSEKKRDRQAKYSSFWCFILITKFQVFMKIEILTIRLMSLKIKCIRLFVIIHLT